MSQQRIKFQGKDWILVGDYSGGGAITTEDDYRHGRVSYAHLFEDGRVISFTEQIGTRDDIEFGEPCNIQHAEDFVEGMISDPGWDGVNVGDRWEEGEDD